jgi:recombinational DNA repair protein (RecF pathway)
MTAGPFGAKPVVLRCSRCGKFVDWADARVQVICNCRPRLELPPVFVREVTAGERDAIIQLFAREFGETHIVAFGEVMDLEAAPALTKSGSKDS